MEGGKVSEAAGRGKVVDSVPALCVAAQRCTSARITLSNRSMESSLTDDSSVGGGLALCSFAPDEEAVDRPGRTRGEVARRRRGRPRLGAALARTEAAERVLVFGITMATSERRC